MPDNERLGASFSIDVTQLKAGLAQANRLIRESKSEFKAAAAGMDDWSKSEDGLNAKLKSLNQIAGVQGETVRALQQEYDRLIDEGLDPTSAQAVKLRTDINNQQAAFNSTQSEIRKYNGQLDSLTNETDDASEAADDLEDNVTNAGKAAEDASNGFTVMKGALASLVADGISKAVDGLKSFVSGAVEAGSNFDASMSNVAALSGAAGEELEMLRDTAKDFGESTKFSASEAADALGYMALAGWDAEQSASALGGVLDLAAASNMDLAEASDMVTDYMSAFNMEAKDSAYFADLLAFAQANANTTTAGLGEAFKNSAANMNAAGQDIETTVSLLSMMANQGLKGSEAGTALTAVMRDLTAKMDDGAISIGDTSVAVMDANGNYRDLTDILKDVEAATDGMGDAEKAAALSTTFTADSIKGLNLILNAGVDNAEDFEKQLRNSSGAAGEMAAVMQDNLQGDLSKLNSAFEGLQLTLYETADGSMREIVQSVTNELLPAFTDFAKGVDGSGKRVGAAVGKIVNNILKTIVKAAPQIVQMGFTLILSLTQGILSALPDIVTAGAEIITSLIAGLGEAIPQLIQQIIEITPQIIQALADAIPLLIDGALSFFMAIVDAIPLLIPLLVQALPQIVETIYTALYNAIPQLIEAAITLLNAIVEAIPQFIPLLVQALPEIITTITQSFVDNFPVILDGAIQLFMALVEAIPTIAVELLSALPQIVTAVIDGLSEPLKGLFAETWDFLTQGASDAWEAIKGVWEVVSGWFDENVITPVKDFFTDAWETLTQGASDAWEAIKGVWEVVSGWFNDNVITPVKNFFTDAWETISQAASGAWETIKGVWAAVSGWFSDTVISPVKNFFSDAWGALTQGASDAWEGIKSVFTSIPEWFEQRFADAWQAVKDVFSSTGEVFEGIKEGIVEAFKAVVNVIIRGINKVIALPLNGLNSVLDEIQNVSFLGITPFSWVSWRAPIPQIPELARGGVVKKATTAVVGEDGDEAIVPLENNTQWIKKVAKEIAAEQQPNVNVYQTNNYSQAHSRYEIYKSKQQTAAAVRLALAGG